MNCNFDERETAWYSWDEWKNVGALLYCFSDCRSQIKGINMINIWKSRVRNGTLPVSVELTATLVAAYLGNSDDITEDQWRLSMGMAIVRFVNGVTDQLQTGIYAQSVQVIADQIKIPDWIVDLRHEATHSQLPGTDILKSSLMFALTWLSENYWQETISRLEEKENLILEELNAYSNFVSSIINDEAIKSVEKISKKQFHKFTDRCIILSSALVKLTHNGNLKRVVKHIVRGDCLLYTGGRLCQLPIISIDQEWSDECFKSINLLVKLWKPLLISLDSTFPEFQELLFSELTKYAYDKKTELNFLITLFILHKINFFSVKAVSFLMKYPSKLSFSLLKYYISEREFPQKEVVVKLVELIGLSPNFLSKSQSIEIQPLLNVQQKDIINKLRESLYVEENNVQIQTWALVTEPNLSSLPPMGEFDQEYNIEILDLVQKPIKKSINKISNTQLDKKKHITEKVYEINLVENFAQNTISQSSYSDSPGKDINDSDQLNWDVDFSIIADSNKKENHEGFSNKMLHLIPSEIFIF